MTDQPSDEEREFTERFRGYLQKKRYTPVFESPTSDDWTVRANWEDAYYRAAHAIVTSVAEGRYPTAVEGVAGLFLFRHYLELALKYIILHSRWLKDSETRATAEEIAEVKKTHSLKTLWQRVKTEAFPKITDDAWKDWDVEFVDACVLEFDTVDPGGERFRYHARRFGGSNAGRRHEYLWIDFARLAKHMPHVHEVLEMIDLWFYETHGELEDWEADMATW